MKILEDLLILTEKLQQDFEAFKNRPIPKPVLDPKPIAEDITRYLNHKQELAEIKQALSELNRVAANIPNSTRVVKVEEYALKKGTWWWVLAVALLISLTIFLTPTATQTYREYQLAKELERLQAQVDYYKAKNPKYGKVYFPKE